MKVFLIIAVFVVLLLLSTMFWQGKEDKLPRGNLKPPEKPPSRDAGAPPSEMAARDTLFVPDSQADDPKGTLKDNILDHIERIFPGAADPLAGGSPPLSYGNVQKDILDEVLLEIASLQNFRAEHRQLNKILNDPSLQIGKELAKMVTSDPVLAAKILNTVNSPYYGLPQKVDAIGHALLLLGVVQLREILYRNGLLKLFRTEDPIQNEIAEALWKHATVTSICASHLHGLYGGMNRGTLFTLGLLHDIGKLILLKWAGAEKYQANLTIAEEDRLFGINHAIIARMALQTWGFSDLMVSVIERHHAPSLCDANGLDVDEQKKNYLIILFYADQLAKLILEGGDAKNINPFLPSYLPAIDRQRFLDTSVDNVLLSSLRQSEVFAR
jgi:HD-like signal output (HDOD) protein